MSTDLSSFELAAICHIAEDYSKEMPELFESAERITVVARENTGDGFFALLQVPNEGPRWSGRSPIGERLYKIDHYGAPFGIVLFFADGLPSLLDCHFFEEGSTLETDFTKATFRPCEQV